MELPNKPIPTEVSWVSILHWGLISIGVAAPWISHFVVGWWAAILVMIAFSITYDWLFVPDGSICMGIPFMLPFSTSLILLCFQAFSLFMWCLGVNF